MTKSPDIREPFLSVPVHAPSLFSLLYTVSIHSAIFLVSPALEHVDSPPWNASFSLPGLLLISRERCQGLLDSSPPPCFHPHFPWGDWCNPWGSLRHSHSVLCWKDPGELPTLPYTNTAVHSRHQRLGSGRNIT